VSSSQRPRSYSSFPEVCSRKHTNFFAQQVAALDEGPAGRDPSVYVAGRDLEAFGFRLFCAWLELQNTSRPDTMSPDELLRDIQQDMCYGELTIFWKAVEELKWDAFENWVLPLTMSHVVPWLAICDILRCTLIEFIETGRRDTSPVRGF
jgi:hypothetical protein